MLITATAVAVLAQTDSCSSQTSAASEADLVSMAGCSTFSGTLTISGPSITSITLNWASLTGTLKVASNRHLEVLSLEGLKSSTGTITLFNNTILSSVKMPNVTSLNVLEIITAPNLRKLSLPQIESVGTLKAEDTGFDNSGPVPWTDLRKAGHLGLSNNKALKSIEIPHLGSVSSHLVVSANGLMEGGGEGSALLASNLSTCSNCTFRHLTELDLSNLVSVGSALALAETNLKSVKMAKLKSVGQTLSIASNNQLANVTFPELGTIGGALQVANNSILTQIDGFPKLTEIGGVLDIRGAITNATWPAIKSVQGGLTVMSSTHFDCTTLANVKAGTRGKVQCQEMSKSAQPSSNRNGNSSDADSSAGSTSMHRGSALAALILLSGLALMF
ncbi:hypothetical protein DFQ27_001614 [Actinomortierella ambigua]|uniref:Uncharacterized protein n=1 Tax=Actinomortierella ambigua TaxID=1343610 RepID=A0A9P6U7E6_9FUNG|nr:hypothetical protein DFQ27_001614 [Actinomortierella ambigua]